MASRFAALAAEMHSVAASHDPQSMTEVKEELTALEGALGDIAGALKALTVKSMETWPLSPGVSGAVGTVHELALKAQAAAADVPTALRALHETELQRLEQPRTNEQMWDVRAQ